MPAPQASTSLLPGGEGRHYAQIKAAIPESLVSASPALRAAITQAKPEIPAWYAATTPAQKAALQNLLEASIKSHTALEQATGKVQEVNAFARPLLEAALKAAGFELGVNQVHLRLYVPVEGLATGYRTKTLSLLQAALNNFEARETRAGFFDSASGFITAPGADGRFERHTTTLTIETFARLCRDLDLGRLYQEHLTTYLLPVQTVSRNLLRERFITRQKDAFRAAAYVALLKGDIRSDDYALLLRIANGERRIKHEGKQVWHRWPSIMELQMHGCLMIDPSVEHGYGTWLIVYIPDHPEHPIKRYKTFADYAEETTRELTAYRPEDYWDSRGVQVTAHQQFFSRFIGKKYLAYYYGRFTEKRVDEPQRRVALGPDPAWRQYYARKSLTELQAINAVIKSPRHISRTPQDQPNLNLNAHPIKGLWIDVDPWDELYADMRKRALDDGLSMAIPTAHTDAAGHDRRMAHLMNIGLFTLNLVSMFIPPLGALMAVVTAGQLLYEVLEGVVELGQGDREAGWAHIADVLENLAQLAVGGAALHISLSPFIEGLKAVRLPSGKARLWKPDLAPYAQDIRLPAGSVPDQAGLHTVNGRQVVSVDGNRYAVTAQDEPGVYRVQHPSRPEAYEPQIVNNGSGAWTHEADEPLTWQGAPLMRRLSHVMEGLSDTQLEQVRKISDTDESVLRRLYVESEPTPAITLDTAVRMRAYGRAESLSGQILAGSMSMDLGSYAASLMVEMTGWPPGRTIEVFDGQGTSRTAALYGQPHAPGTELISISRIDLFGGKLPALIVESLPEEQLKNLLGQHMPYGAALRSQALQERLGIYAKQSLRRVFDSLYLGRSSPGSAELQLFARDFKSLPPVMVEELLEGASPSQRASLVNNRKIPLELAQQARQKLGELRLARAYEGLYLDALANADTEALVLNTLEHLPGWRDSLRIEVHEGSVSGRLRASYGLPGSSNLKLLVRVGDGQYQVFDTQGNELHGVDSLYDSLQHALPEAHRQSVGLPEVGQGPQLGRLIQQHALSRAGLRKVLGMQPLGSPFFISPQRSSRGRIGYAWSGRGAGSWEHNVRQRIKALYPTFDEVQIAQLRAPYTPADDTWLISLEQEYEMLRSTLETWEASPIQGFGEANSAEYREQRAIRKELRKVLIRAWRRNGEVDVDSSGNPLGQKIEVSEIDIQPQLASLPALSANFDHVTYLEISSAELTNAVEPFLAPFRGLRTLNLEDNQLTRLPLLLEHLPRLETLILADNEIVLDVAAVNRLKNLTRLQTLELESNPLGMAPDISRMRRLYHVSLGDTGQRGWPIGIFARPRPREFNLDLEGNALEVPIVEPGSAQAAILARTRVTRSLLTPEGLRQLKQYIASVGMDPERQFPPRGMQGSIQWKSGLTDMQWRDLQPLWNALEESRGAEPFFNEIRKLSESADAVSEDFAQDLTAKVWRMLRAMYDDTRLREKLFDMARAPTSCVDAGAQLFNAMGIEVMVYEAWTNPHPDVVEQLMLTVAKGRTRLNKLGEIARARVAALSEQGRKFPNDRDRGTDSAGNPERAIDEVGVHLAFSTGLAQRLELPWQSADVMYPEPDVTPQMLDDAFDRVMALEEGDLLRDALVELDFWGEYLERSTPAAFVWLTRKRAALEDLTSALNDLAANGRLLESQKMALRNTLRNSALMLDKSVEDFPPGTPMHQDVYDALAVKLHEEHKAILQRLTDEALEIALQNRK